MRWLGYLVFLVVSVGILAAVHYYFWARLVRDPGWAQPWRTLATVVLLALAASMPLAFVVGRFSTTSAAKALVWPAYVWMGAMWMLLVVVAGTDVVRLLGGAALKVAQAAPAAEAVRQVMTARVLAAGAIGVVLLASGWALVQGLSFPAVRRVEVTLPRLPAALDGTTVVQISDVHVGPTRGRAFIEQLVRRINELRPDVVAITGDLVDGGVGHLNHSVQPLARLEARHGVFFVTGNHEYYAGVEEWTRALGELGVRVLSNQRVAIGDAAASFDLAGIPDPTAERMGGTAAPSLERALAGRDPSRALVLLAHQPKAVDEASARGVGLQLSGHTHGGQIWPWGYLVGLTQPYVSGMARHGDTQIYVSNGTGYWGPPMRLLAPAEITLFELRSPRS